MQAIGTSELERLVQETFPGKLHFSAEAELGVNLNRRSVVTFVHGGPDPFLDRPFENWLRGGPVFVSVHQLLNRLCRAGALAPGHYALARSGNGSEPPRQTHAARPAILRQPVAATSCAR
ncbi:MAG: hypothetical protein WCE38_25675 [Burkholderiales bacterium]